ncbi:cytochrome b-c1 complex subunit 9, mitochondrial [Trichomonascus vanleenenianus]|uniref:ubiquinol--cytochrome-c reductase subunit 9 n=1 Tax=Trichomonascus vanleenenianus TaxID=2268995 RepID=UPI003ECAE457
MSFYTTIYNTVFKRNSIFVGTVFLASFAYDAAFHKTFDAIFDSLNTGKQWKDIRHRYVTKDEDDE